MASLLMIQRTGLFRLMTGRRKHQMVSILTTLLIMCVIKYCYFTRKTRELKITPSWAYYDQTSSGNIPKDKMSHILIKHSLFVNNKTVASNEDTRFHLEGEEVNRKVVQYVLGRLSLPAEHEVLSRAATGTCIVVASGACLRDRSLGHVIDSYDVILRVNHAEIHGYEHLVGSRTDIRLGYPESAPGIQFSELYNGKNGRKAIFVILPYKPADIIWLARLFNDSVFQNLDAKFWQEVPDKIPIPLNNILLVNPYMLYYPRFLANARMTAGMAAVRVAGRICFQVDIAGFCYSPEYHYLWYYGNTTMEQHLKLDVPHSRFSEARLREHFKIRGVINKDLTPVPIGPTIET